MAKKKTEIKFLKRFDKVFFPDETEYFIFLIWALFVCVFFIQYI
jgi:hypothetical protein